MSTAIVLALPDFTKRFMIENDAYSDEIRVILMQEGELTLVRLFLLRINCFLCIKNKC